MAQATVSLEKAVSRAVAGNCPASHAKDSISGPPRAKPAPPSRSQKTGAPGENPGAFLLTSEGESVQKARSAIQLCHVS